MNPMTNALLDTVVKFGFVIVLAFLIRSVLRGDFRIDPNHKYAEAQVHAYNTAGTWDLYYGKSTIRYFHEECAKEHLADTIKVDEWYELWVNEKDTPHHCQHCE